MSVPTGATVWRDWKTDGVPSSGVNEPDKSDIRQWALWLEGYLAAGVSNGALIYQTRAALQADLSAIENASAWVVGDPVSANNGIYRKTGASGTGSWSRIADLPYSFITASNVGAGTPNAIAAVTDQPLPTRDGAALIAVNIMVANTAAPSIAFNGGAALPIRSADGAVPVAGSLTAGSTIAGFIRGGEFRLITDLSSQASAAAAEAARQAAVTAANTANAAATGAQGSAAAAAADAAEAAADAAGANAKAQQALDASATASLNASDAHTRATTAETNAAAARATADAASEKADDAMALAETAAGIGTLSSDNVTNTSNVTGTKVTDALNELRSGKADKSALGTAAGHADTDFATAAQGGKADGALQAANLATVAQFRAGTTGGKVLGADTPYAAADYVTLADAASIAVNFSAGINFTVTLAGNRTLAFPTNPKPGQRGSIEVRQDATGSRTLAYASGYKWPMGVKGVLSTAANAIDEIFYSVRSTGEVRLSLTNGWD